MPTLLKENTSLTAIAPSPAAVSSAQASRRGPRHRRLVRLLACGITLVAVGAASGGWWLRDRYSVADEMLVPVTEYTTAEYPEDPAHRSVRYGRYGGRSLRLNRRNDTHFDFRFEPQEGHVATIEFKNVDVSLMSVKQPEWVKDDPGLTRISLIDREWNRQQVQFAVPGGQIEVTGGDGFEAKNLVTASLAKNCLNAGLWEILLFVEEDGQKALYYQGWFRFPLGHYAELFERNTGLDYADWWWPMEHWQDPAGTSVRLDGLRTVKAERDAEATFDLDEPILFAGEQVRKVRTANVRNHVAWRDFFDGSDATFASFIPPGRYSVEHPWGNEYERFARFEKAYLREINSPGRPDATLHEIELAFSSTDGEPQRLFVGGVDLTALPRLPVSEYQKGLYMPMGIGVPPFYQTYEELQAAPPAESPYYSVLLDAQDHWIDHHSTAVDGPVLHRDADDPGLVHLYLLSYERHTLIAHFTVRIDHAGRTAAAE